MSDLVWTTEGFNHRAQGRRRVYWVKAEPLGTNRFRPAIQRGAVTFYCDCPFHKLDDAKAFCQDDHDSIGAIVEESRTHYESALKEALCHCEDAFRSNNPQAINYSEALCRCIATLNKVLGEKS